MRGGDGLGDVGRAGRRAPGTTRKHLTLFQLDSISNLGLGWLSKAPITDCCWVWVSAQKIGSSTEAAGAFAEAGDRSRVPPSANAALFNRSEQL